MSFRGIGIVVHLLNCSFWSYIKVFFSLDINVDIVWGLYSVWGLLLSYEVSDWRFFFFSFSTSLPSIYLSCPKRAVPCCKYTPAVTLKKVVDLSFSWKYFAEYCLLELRESRKWEQDQGPTTSDLSFTGNYPVQLSAQILMIVCD